MVDYNSRAVTMVNGLPGNMATLMAKAIVNSDEFSLYHSALTGPKGLREFPTRFFRVSLWSPHERNAFARIHQFEKINLVVDYTAPDAANANGEIYCNNGWDFVMGTTGLNRLVLEEKVRQSGVCAIIPPNTSKHIVELQFYIEKFAENNPGFFHGSTLNITESHQADKKDTSGTAKDMIQYFNQLGIAFSVDQINKIRDSKIQRQMGVPEEHIRGHAWHTYTITSQDNPSNVLKFIDQIGRSIAQSKSFKDYKFEASGNDMLFVSPDRSIRIGLGYDPINGVGKIVHDTLGRNMYVDGTFDAMRFLRKKKAEGVRGKVFSMIDVVRDAA